MDVTRENFSELFPQIRKAIEDAAFISIDGEFTGLSTSILHEPALFDTPDIRYEKLRKSMSNFTMCQCGISMFVPDHSIRNSYKAYTFNFFLTAPSFGPIDGRFICQASALEFLTNHNFDFNTFIKHGVSYMNKDQERLFWQYHKSDNIQQHISSMLLRQYDEKYLNPALAKINSFLAANDKNSTLEIDLDSKGLCQYLFLKSVEKSYTNIGCLINRNGKITIKILPGTDSEFDFEQQYKILAKQLIGFSSVIHLISELAKPLIGHNMIGDLILIYGLFFHSLPDTYMKFKSCIHKIFPVIYDTKHITFMLRKEFRPENFFESTCLENLYNLLNSSPVRFYKLYTPQITHAEGFKKYENANLLHEAGYDAYLTGYIFIRLAHLNASKNIPSTESKPLEFEDHMKALLIMKNCINMPRAAVRYINFGGKDPPINLPQRFIVTLKKRSGNISANQVAHDFLPFGSVDVKLRSATKALVAVSYRKKARDVVRAFSRNKYYHVVQYNPLYHSSISESVVWYGSIGTSFLIFITILGIFYKKSSR